MDEIGRIPTDRIVYLDETGIDDNEVVKHSWEPIGTRAYSSKNAVRKKRISIIGALKNRTQLSATFIFEGMCDRNVFEIYLKKVLVTELKPGDVVVLDNASFHKGGNIEQIIRDAGCCLLYLPPYSPDLNPIEHFWAAVKNRIRKLLNKCSGDIYCAATNALNVAC